MRLNVKRGLLISFLLSSALAASAQLYDGLRAAGNMSWSFNDGDYTFDAGPVGNFQGNLGDQDNIVITFEELGSGTGLDFRIDLHDVINAFQDEPDPSDLIPFMATLLGNDQVRWTFDRTFEPPLCTVVTVEGTAVTVGIERVWGLITMQISADICGPDPLGMLSRNVRLHLRPTGGDDVNNMNLRAKLFCITNTQVNGNVVNLDIDTYGGEGTPSEGDVDSNCCVDDADLSAVIFEFGGPESGSFGNTDLNDDGVVDDADLATVIFNFGSGC